MLRTALRIGALMAIMTGSVHAAGLSLEKAPGTIRIATFNADMARKGAGVLVQDIRDRDPQVLAVAEIIQRVQPDILLINELDHDPGGMALEAFGAVLAEGIGDLPGWVPGEALADAVNTGWPTGFDLDGDGRSAGPRDAYGFGRFPGQYGMAVLVRAPLEMREHRAFRTLKWSDLPWVEPPMNPDGTPHYAPEAWAVLRMSSKSHWDVPVRLPDGRVLHVLASHPTPPVFDGPENRNGLRNAAEIRFWGDYIDGAAWIRDDAGRAGGLDAEALFVILGDLNADPEKGDGDRATVRVLTRHPRVQDPAPESPGAAAVGDARDTADWPEEGGPGNLRVDYVLPSTGLEVTGAGVFWPAPEDPLARLVVIRGRDRTSSDHRLVWVDIRLEAP